MSLELLKLICQPVLIERDADGAAVGEQVADAIPVYSAEQAAQLFQAITDQLEARNEMVAAAQAEFKEGEAEE